MLIGILCIIIIFLLVIILNMKDKLIKEQIKYSENDKLLTKYVADNLDMERKLLEMQEDYEKQQDMSAEIKKMQEQSRLLKHDMKNHILVILGYLEAGDMIEARKYVSVILDKLNKMYTYVNVGNSLLSYIINSKLSLAKEMGIEIKAEIENLPFNYMDSVDFSALLNNILDNAIEAAATVISRDRRMEVKILSTNGFDTICVKNTIESSVLEKNPNLTSTKEEVGHGFGIKQIRGICEKYDGMVDFDEQEGMFIVSIMLGVS